MDIIIRDGTLVTGNDIFQADIGIKNGQIVSLSNNLLESAREEINALGKYIFPGFIDAHTHLDMPVSENISSVDDFYTGTLAAAFGGTTTIVDYVVPSKYQTLTDALKMWQRKSMDKAVIDYGFHMTISNPTDKILDEISELHKLGVTSVKCFTAYKNTFMLDDSQLYRVLKESVNNKILVCLHAENGLLLDYKVSQLIKAGKTTPKYHALSRPNIIEHEAIGRVINIARLAEAPVYIAHISTNEGLIKVKENKSNNLPVYAETCPHYLMISSDKYDSDDIEAAKYVCSPPLRSNNDINGLWDGVINDDIHVIATDHCPFNSMVEKKSGLNLFTTIPNGLPGIEDRVHIMFSEGVVKRNLNLNRFVSITSVLPAKIFGLYPKKGTLTIGSDADIVMFDPSKEWLISAKTHHQNVDYNVYEGHKIQGKVEMVISRGEIIIRNNQFQGKKGRGQYIKRNNTVLSNTN